MSAKREPVRSRAERDRLVTEHLGIAHRAARDFCRAYPDLVAKIGTAGDVVGEAVVKLIRAAELWDPGQGVSFFRYAYVSCRRGLAGAVHRLAGSKRFALSLVGAEERVTDGGAGPAAEAEVRDEVAELRRALAELPERQREAVLLYDLQGQTFYEVGARLGVTRQAVQDCRRRALAALRVRLG